MKIKKCRICKKEIANNDKCIAIKEKMLYDLEDGGDLWYNFQKAMICWDCVKRLREMISQAK
jgi:hypothetical protein